MPDISRDEFHQLLAAAQRLPRCWYLFRHSNSPGKINFQYSFFIRDFINSNRYFSLTALDSSPEKPVIQLSFEDYLYLKKCLEVTNFLELLLELEAD